jgi:hypothetical protein
MEQPSLDQYHKHRKLTEIMGNKNLQVASLGNSS